MTKAFDDRHSELKKKNPSYLSISLFDFVRDALGLGTEVCIVLLSDSTQDCTKPHEVQQLHGSGSGSPTALRDQELVT